METTEHQTHLELRKRTSSAERPIEQRDRRFLGWKNVTSYLDKVQDVELGSASGEDKMFVSIHHDIRDLLDVQDEVSDVLGVQDEKLGNDIKKLTILELYTKFRNGDKEILVNVTDKRGRETGERMDLYAAAHLRRIKALNELLCDDKMPESELKENFWSGKPLEIGITMHDATTDKPTSKKDTIDLAEKAERPYVSADDFAYYLNAIKESQTGLQKLSALREPSIKIHHAENGGHVQMMQVEPGKFFYVPVGLHAAREYMRGDVKKTSDGFRAAGHVHEIGWYEENTSSLVRIEADAYKTWRGGIGTTRTHEQTNNRMFDNCVALASGEKLRSTDKQAKSYHFGGEGKGKIYQAMHHHYDRMMTEVRGYGITDQEIGDKIVTDIVGVAFAINPADWLMSFAAATGVYASRMEIMKPEIVEDRKKGGEGKPVFIFDGAKHPKGVEQIDEKTSFQDLVSADKVDYGTIKVHGIPALAKYIQWRIGLGDVCGISSDTKIEVKGVEEKGEKRGGEKEEKKKIELKEEQVAGFASALSQIFDSKDKARELVERQREKGKKNAQPFSATLNIGGEQISIDTPEKLKQFIEKRIKEKTEISKLVLQLTNITEPSAATAALLELLDKVVDKDLERIINALK